MYETVSRILSLLISTMQDNKSFRIVSLISSSIILIAGGISWFLYRETINTDIAPLIMIILVLSFGVLLCSLLAFSKYEIQLDNFDMQLKKLFEEREELKKRVVKENEESEVEATVFNTIQLNLNQTTEYYTINKAQAKRSFNASVTAIIAGFITIIAGIWLFYFSESLTISIITVASSVLLEVIGGLYFHIYNKSQDQVNYFYDKLEKMQDTMLAIELTNGISDEGKKLEIQEKIIINLIDRSSNK
ncbi:hypothetical protein AB9M62_25245 [Bacillales bacterium AN1005]